MRIKLINRRREGNRVEFEIIIKGEDVDLRIHRQYLRGETVDEIKSDVRKCVRHFLALEDKEFKENEVTELTVQNG